VTSYGYPPVGDDDVVVLVDATDASIGVAPKLDVHRDGRLHRAVSVVLFDGHGRVMLQRRAEAKYHSGGLWSNSCCGHPRPGESVEHAAGRRLNDELGVEGCEVTRVGELSYFADLGNGLVEHELDHIVVGQWGGAVTPNPLEVAEVRWVEPAALFAHLAEAPAAYTAWAGPVIAQALRRIDVDSVSTGG
jgi:isopentenyl-diphosphate delta-isomerase